MFKKPLGNLKTAAPLRGSDRRKFKQRVIATFPGVSSEEGDQLVPEGIQSIKFSTHLNENGVAYLAPEGDPLWFTIGKGSDELIPTIYTLWKKPDLLPFLSTPPSVIPVLVGGADLMIPGVVHRPPPPSLAQGQLVSVCQFTRRDEKNPTLSAPLAVGRLAVPSDQMAQDGKGKAVLVLHAWKDHLWEMGSKGDAPEPTVLGDTDEQGETKDDEVPAAEPPTELETPAPTPGVSYTPQEVTDILHKSLLQAISTLLSSLPPSTFPIPSTQFYTNYILPCRPAYPIFLFPPSSSFPLPPDLTKDQAMLLVNPNDITIKTSTHKSLTMFLKAAEKASLLTLKSPQKHSQQADLLVMSVNKSHPGVDGHVKYETLKEAEDKAAKRAKKDEANGAEAGGEREVGVRLLWKPHLESVALFEGIGGDPKALYALQQVKTLLNDYISSKDLVNPNDRAYINLDGLLIECISAKGHQKSKKQDTNDDEQSIDFMKRDELVKKVIGKMQNWYEITRDGEVTQKKGTLKPIQVVTKVRQGKKASTYITGFEPFMVVGAEAMADELRKLCASATSVATQEARQGGLKVLVQGKQSKAAQEYLLNNGVPKQWIEVHD